MSGRKNEARPEPAKPVSEFCHCGRTVHVYEELDGFTRNMCLECSTVRCDIIEGSCPVIEHLRKVSSLAMSAEVDWKIEICGSEEPLSPR